MWSHGKPQDATSANARAGESVACISGCRPSPATPVSSGCERCAAPLGVAEMTGGRTRGGPRAVYLAVVRRYGTTLVSRDREQLARGSAVGRCQTPEDALAGR